MHDFWVMRNSFWLFLFLGSLSTVLLGQIDISERLKLLREKSKSHQSYIDSLIGGRSINKTVTKVESEKPSSNLSGNSYGIDSPVQNAAELPKVTLPDPVLSEIDRSFDESINEVPFNPPAPDSTFVKQIDVEFDYQDEGLVNKEYENLYKSSYPERRLGYYFGPFLGFAFPDDIANHQSNNGMLVGLRLGRDFGSLRVEGEYSFLSHEIEAKGDSNLHNFFSRLILENELGDRADLRAGIGLGLSSVSTSMGDHFGFAYDFLLGWSYRVSDNWSICLDYRYFLTAASEDIGRAQGLILEFATNFDI